MADRTTLNDLLDRAAREQAGLRFIDREERAAWHPWSAIRERARNVGAALQAEGVVPGDRVALVYPTCPEFFDAMFGILYAGGVPVPLYPPVRLGRLDEYRLRTAAMIDAAQVRLVLAQSRVRRILGEVIRTAGPARACKTLDSLPRGSNLSPNVHPGELALVQFSSGTTMDPKPVALSHAALVAQVRVLNQLWHDTQGPRHSGVSWLPLYHDMGLVGCVLTALDRDAALTLIPPENFVARPATWLRTISRYRATISPAPNFAYGLCVRRIRDEELDGVDLSCWKAALNGAESVSPRVLREFAGRFSRFGFEGRAMSPVYGMSEAALAVTFSDLNRSFVSRRFDRCALAEDRQAHPTEDGLEIVSVGRPLPGYGLRIVDGHQRRLPEGSVGRVWVRGPSIMQGYLDRPHETAQVMHGDWLDSGDLGFVLDDELYLTGRAKDQLILRGRNHAPEEVEQALHGIAGVRAGCVVAVSYLPEDGAEERLLVFVESRGGPRDLARRCTEAILAATGLAADEIVVLEAGTLPRTSSGKLRRQASLHQYRNRGLRPPDRVTRISLAAAVARSSLAYARMKWE